MERGRQAGRRRRATMPRVACYGRWMTIPFTFGNEIPRTRSGRVRQAHTIAILGLRAEGLAILREELHLGQDKLVRDAAATLADGSEYGYR
jgi:hypothetical protein